MNYRNRIGLYRKLEQARKSKVICYVTSDRRGASAQIGNDAYPWFVEHLDKIGVVPRITLVLHTLGGATMAAVSIMNLIRHFCDEYEVIVPRVARSAGTLMSLGADKILMTKQATLGPIDPSLGGVSVEAVQGYLDLATSQFKITDQEQRAQVFLKLAEQVPPLTLGAVARTRAQTQMLTRRILSDRKVPELQIQQIISFLCSESGSHDYPIHRREARSLGLQVEKPSESLYGIIDRLYKALDKDFQFHQPLEPESILAGEESKDYSFRNALIESVEGGADVFTTAGRFTVTQPDPAQRIIHNTIRSAGWNHFTT
jgi:ATP-dependent protease ClpP protease subunit